MPHKRNSESAAFTSFRKGVLKMMDRADRIENILSSGMPDANCCIEGREFWMEVKAPTEPRRPSTPLFGSNHRFSQDQINWMLMQNNAGGNVFLYIDTDRHRLLLPSSIADKINSMSFTEIFEQSLWCAIKPTNKQAWEMLRETILENCKNAR